MALQAEGFPVALLLAEEVSGRDWRGAANVPGLDNSLDDVLSHWPDGARGFLITDALDAVRDAEAQKMLRRLLRDVQAGKSGWTVVASVREFDLKHGMELREAFPGDGVAGHAATDFAAVAHFHLSGFSEAQLDELASNRAEIRPFVESARRSPKSGAMHRSPFYLRLAAELLRDGVTPTRLADWSSPAILLRKFWEARVEDDEGVDERGAAVAAICREMVTARRMALSEKEIRLNSFERKALRELRSRGILQGPAIHHGTRVRDEAIRFTHHLLHDYAIARSLIPATEDRFCAFAIQEPLLPVFYRQSFMFALEELWDSDQSREPFWQSAFRLESEPTLHGLTRILAPILAARRVETLSDLQPLLSAVTGSNAVDSPALKALRHLASGLQDASPDLISASARSWSAFAQRLAKMLPSSVSVEASLVQILARLNEVEGAKDKSLWPDLSAAGRTSLDLHVTKEISESWRYAGRVAIETICRTFNAAPVENEAALLTLLTPRRVAQFPHNDLFDLANNLKHLGPDGDPIVLRLFEAAFAAEPQPDQWEQFGTAILPMRIQRSDQWNSIYHVLAGYYQECTVRNAGLLAEIACIAWNAVVRRRVSQRNKEQCTIATIQFRGVACPLIEDFCHIWHREFAPDEARIVSHFERLLREWAGASDSAQLNAALDRFASRNLTSDLWTVFMEAGAQHPSTLGLLLACVLDEPVFLTHSDYAQGGTALLGALHKVGNTAERERLEKLIINLPRAVRLRRGERRRPASLWVEYAQNRLLGSLEESNIVLGPVRDLWRGRQKADGFSASRQPERPQAGWRSNDGLVRQGGSSPKEPTNEEILRLREALKAFFAQDGREFDASEVERKWLVIQQCERAVRRHANRHPKMARELWGHLVGACECIATHTTWPPATDRWRTVRRILLKAAEDPMPKAGEDEDEKDEGPPAYGWPAPRVDAARGLPYLAYRLGQTDKAIATALCRLCRDKSHAVRFNLASPIAVLEKPAPQLMWTLVDAFVAYEQKFSVLDALVISLSRLWSREPEGVISRLRQIADRAKGAPADNHIHQTLAHAHLMQYLRAGHPDCERFIASLIADCDSQQASDSLSAQLHNCREGGWLTAGDGVKPDAHADGVRARTWAFFSKVLSAAQTRLRQHRDTLSQLHQCGGLDPDAVKPVREKLERAAHLVDGIAMQLFFGSGALDETRGQDKGKLTPVQTRRFWWEASPLFAALATEPHPHTAYHLIQAMGYLLPCAPREVFLLAANSIRSSATAGFQHDVLAVGEVVKLVQRALADHRDLFQTEAGQHSECLTALLEVLDLFVEAGWAEARQLTHRLEEIYR